VDPHVCSAGASHDLGGRRISSESPGRATTGKRHAYCNAANLDPHNDADAHTNSDAESYAYSDTDADSDSYGDSNCNADFDAGLASDPQFRRRQVRG
jgi:hypothetical protein